MNEISDSDIEGNSSWPGIKVFEVTGWKEGKLSGWILCEEGATSGSEFADIRDVHFDSKFLSKGFMFKDFKNGWSKLREKVSSFV